ncbi:DMT family transporter [Rhodovibrio salinarum]|uniref:EamA family transporter n=1 Tax=Rhodovibrio salinarum TaxID=1087 RepID=A0A934QGR2_9PROT|nr:EamA family transporter [Rhodovibrio salinarum]MBK1696489.1 EamA family transporter [Rhodovibrio salinarum]
MRLAVRPLDLFGFIAIMIVWGSNFAVSKVGLQELPPILLVGLRFMIVAALLVPFVKVPKGKLLGVFAVSVVLGFLHFSLMFTGLTGIDASTAAISIQLQVPFAAILAALAFGETVGWRRALGMAIAFAGVAVIAGEPRLDGAYGSLALVLSAALVWAVANVLVKRLDDINGTQLNAYMAAFAFPQLFFASFLLEGGQWDALASADWLTVGLVLAYQSVIVVVLGYGLWYALLGRYDVNIAMPFTLMVPFFGVASGVIALGEPLTWRLLAGGAMTVIGVGIVTIRRPRVTGPTLERT